MRERYGIKHGLSPAMEITTMIGCPLMCTFCPQDNLRDSYGKDTKYMQPMDLMTVLAKLPKNTRIDFSGMSEPWANPEATTMLEMVLYMGFDVAIYTTLYGMNDPERVIAAIQKYPNQIKEIVLHMPDANGNMKGWKFTDEWKKAATLFFNAKMPCKISAMTMDGSGRVHEDLVPFSSGSLPTFQGHTRAGSLDVEQVKGQEIIVTPRNEFALTCKSSPFFDRNVLLPNGDVVLCCMDYDLKHIIGNLLKQSYADIFEGETLAEIIEINEKPEFDKCSICKSCENVREI